MITYHCDFLDATSSHFWQESLAVSDTTYGETIEYVVPKVPKIVSKVCGERYRLTQNRGQIRSVTVIVEKIRIRSPTWSKRLAKSALALAVNLQVFGFPHIAPGCAN